MELTVIQNKIHEIRGQRVMFDFDLAILYEVETRALKQAVKRNNFRFPSDFMFILNDGEIEQMVSQNVIPSKSKLGGANPMVFTEQGVAMLSTVLKSRKAIDVNISIMRAFVAIRQLALSNAELRYAIEELKNKTDNNSKNIELVFQYLDELLEKKENNEPIKRIGYKHYD